MLDHFIFDSKFFKTEVNKVNDFKLATALVVYFSTYLGDLGAEKLSKRLPDALKIVFDLIKEVVAGCDKLLDYAYVLSFAHLSPNKDDQVNSYLGQNLSVNSLKLVESIRQNRDGRALMRHFLVLKSVEDVFDSLDESHDCGIFHARPSLFFFYV